MAEYGGLQSTDEGGVKYVLQDWQGSTRAIVGNTGNIQSRSDYTAFGEQIGTGGLRSSSQGFGKSTSVRQGYALTEKDDATGLDHTWFRKNENQAGRWTSHDPYNGSMSIGDPQSFNRYSYVANEPTNYVDPSGLLLEYTCYDINTYWRQGPFSSGVMSTTRCHFRVLPDEGGGSDGGVIGSGGSNTSVVDSACEKMVKTLQSAIDTTLKRLGGRDRMINHATLNSLAQGASSLFRNFYVGTLSAFSSQAIGGAPDAFQGFSGFNASFIDTLHPTSDQTHHFAAYFYVGMTGEGWKASAHSSLLDGGNEGDLSLGEAAYSLGQSLRMREVRTQTLMPAYESPASRLERILGIANAVRASICE